MCCLWIMVERGTIETGRARMVSVYSAGLSKGHATGRGRALYLCLQQRKHKRAVPRIGSRADQLQSVVLQASAYCSWRQVE